MIQFGAFPTRTLWKQGWRDGHGAPTCSCPPGHNPSTATHPCSPPAALPQLGKLEEEAWCSSITEFGFLRCWVFISREMSAPLKVIKQDSCCSGAQPYLSREQAALENHRGKNLQDHPFVVTQSPLHHRLLFHSLDIENKISL